MSKYKKTENYNTKRLVECHELKYLEDDCGLGMNDQCHLNCDLIKRYKNKELKCKGTKIDIKKFHCCDCL